MQTLRTHLARLRRKLGGDTSNPRYLLAAPRVGYRMLKGEVQSEGEA